MAVATLNDLAKPIPIAPNYNRQFSHLFVKLNPNLRNKHTRRKSTTMGKDKSEKSSKKEKKESKRSETDGVKKSSKKDKKTKLSDDNVAAAFEEAVKQNGGSKIETKEVVVVKDGEVETAITVRRPVGALVPFAAPLADEKVGKKVLKSVKKGEQLLSLQSFAQ